MSTHDELDALLGAGPQGPDAELGAVLSRLRRPVLAPRPSPALAAYLPLAIASGRTSAPATPQAVVPRTPLPAPRRLVVPAVVGRIAVAAVAVAAVAASVVVGQAVRADPKTTLRVVTPATTGADRDDPSTPPTSPAVLVVPPDTVDPAASTSTDRTRQAPVAGLATSGGSSSGHGGDDAVHPTGEGTTASEHPTPEPSTTDRTPPSTTAGSETTTSETTTSEGSSSGGSSSGDSSRGDLASVTTVGDPLVSRNAVPVETTAFESSG